jgi:hypothetical protein
MIDVVFALDEFRLMKQPRTRAAQSVMPAADGVKASEVKSLLMRVLATLAVPANSLTSPHAFTDLEVLFLNPEHFPSVVVKIPTTMKSVFTFQIHSPTRARRFNLSLA